MCEYCTHKQVCGLKAEYIKNIDSIDCSKLNANFIVVSARCLHFKSNGYLVAGSTVYGDDREYLKKLKDDFCGDD